NNATNGHAQALERAAVELGTSPYWLGRYLRQCGLGTDPDTLAAVKQAKRAASKKGRVFQADHLKGQREDSQAVSRMGRADFVAIARRQDPDLRRWGQSEPTQSPPGQRCLSNRAYIRVWRNNGGAP